MKNFNILRRAGWFLGLLFCACRLWGGEIRLVSLSPNLTEIVFQLGQGDKLVGRSSACDYPEAVKKLPVAGDLAAPFVEKILQLRPTLVISTVGGNPQAAAMLAARGLRYLSFPDRDFRDYQEILRVLGKELHCPRDAEKEIARIAQVAEFPTSRTRRPRVLVLLNQRPLITAGRESFLNRMIIAAGGQNAAAEVAKGYFPCSWEWVLRQQPEIIIAPQMNGGNWEFLHTLPGWKSLPAVTAGRVFTDAPADWLCRLGPRVFQGIEWLREKVGAYSGK